MSEPLTPLMAKIITGSGGFIGGAIFMAFLKPSNVWDAAIRSSVSTATAIISAVPFLDWLGLDHRMDHLIAASALIGFCAWSVLSLLARTLLKIQDEKTTIKLPSFIEKEK